MQAKIYRIARTIYEIPIISKSKDRLHCREISLCGQSHLIHGQQLGASQIRARLNSKSPPHFWKHRWPGMNRGFGGSLERHRIRIEVPSTSARSGNRVSQPQAMVERSILHYSKDRYFLSIFSQELPPQIFFSPKFLSLFSHKKYLMVEN